MILFKTNTLLYESLLNIVQIYIKKIYIKINNIQINIIYFGLLKVNNKNN